MRRPPRFCSSRASRGFTRRGFTLMELTAVVAIITILLVTIVPALDNLAPSSRLDAGGRYVAGTIEIAQSEAISQRTEFVVAYDLERHTYWIILPEGHERSPDQTDDDARPTSGSDPMADPAAGSPKGAGSRPRDDLEHGPPPPEEGSGENSEEAVAEATEATYNEREAFEPNELPDGVRFKAVVVDGETRSSGRVYVALDHRGTTGAHMVGLELTPTPDGQGPTGEVWLRFDPMTRTLTYSDAQPQVPTLEGEE